MCVGTPHLAFLDSCIKSAWSVAVTTQCEAGAAGGGSSSKTKQVSSLHT